MAAALAVAALAAACGGSSSSGGGGDRGDRAGAVDRCDWPMFGRDPARTFASPCPTRLSPATAPRLGQRWYFNTRDVVTASPAVVDGSVYVGDWSGRFYALSLASGEPRWTFDAPPHERVYAGQIVSSAAVADAGGERLVYFGAGKTLYALRAADGSVRWSHELNPDGPADDPTEIESSPVVAGGLVVFGFDGHDEPGVRAGVVALDAATGERRWYFDPDGGRAPTGCAGVWSSPSVDLERRLVFAGSANCVTAPRGWRRYSEAVFALDLDRGTPAWSFQPREPNRNDFDFAGAPNLFTAGGRDLVGLGGKDGVYYALDRASGDVVWKRRAAEVRVASENFSTGGFIGATAVGGGAVAGGTAIGGPCPCLHALDAATGRIRWQQEEAGPTYAASAIAGGLLFVGGTTDFTLRAVDLGTGEIRWSQALAGGVAGGPAIVGDTVVAVAGIREPGLHERSDTSGVYAFTLGAGSAATTTTGTADTLPPTTAAPPATAPGAPVPGPACVAAPCAVPFGRIKEVPAGLAPTLTLHVRPSPFRIEVRAEGLGDPDAWLRPGGRAARAGATTYGVFVTKSDDDPRGALVCVLDGAFDCVSDVLPTPLQPSYSRVSVLAIANTTRLPDPVEGFDRLVTTIAFDPPLVLGGNR